MTIIDEIRRGMTPDGRGRARPTPPPSGSPSARPAPATSCSWPARGTRPPRPSATRPPLRRPRPWRRGAAGSTPTLVIRLLIAAGWRSCLPPGHPFLIDWLPAMRHRPADPRGRAPGPRHQGRAPPRWAAWPSWAACWPATSSATCGGASSRAPASSSCSPSPAPASSGLLDDWIKVSKERNLGLNKRAKMLGLLIVGIGFVVADADRTKVRTDAVSFTRSTPRHRPGQVAAGRLGDAAHPRSTNAVNLTDGLDGLAAGSATFCPSRPTRSSASGGSATPSLRGPPRPRPRGGGGGDGGRLRRLPVVERRPGPDLHGRHRVARHRHAGWPRWRSDQHPPAAAHHRWALRLETLSVIIQVASFRLFGRRIFRMAPIHHHFELGGWPETTVIIRFWILAGLCTALAWASSTPTSWRRGGCSD
jgi:hypothetical protein